MANISPEAIAASRGRLGVPDDHICRSVGIIMDGNGRWAKQQGLSRSQGHRAGAKVVRKIVTEAAGLGLDALTLYSFSIENWARPAEEINVLMHLYADYLVAERPTVMANNIRLRHLGQRDGLPNMVLKELDESIRVSAENTGMYLCLALNYGSRAEMTDAVRRIARKAKEGKIDPEQINPSVISAHLDTCNVPDPDLIIRTSGEMRVSNFLLWQISYSEFYVTDVYWPDFSEQEFRKALIDFATRRRRFGGLNEASQ